MVDAKQYQEAFAGWNDLIGDDYVIVNAEKCIVKNNYYGSEAEEETLTIKDMVTQVKEELDKYYNDEFDVCELYETDRAEWKRATKRLQEFINKYNKPEQQADDKYKLVCGNCGVTYFYKRKSRFVREYKDYSCGYCKEKAFKLTVL